jgi:hypothetical protein
MHSWSSFFTGLCGIISGALYASDTVKLKHFTLPRFINRFCARFLLPLLHSAPTPSRPVRINTQVFITKKKIDFDYSYYFLFDTYKDINE